MKYRKKYIIYSLLAGLIALIESCSSKTPTIQLLGSKDLSLPSASAIEYFNDRLYVIGDDAPYLLILSLDYQVLDTVWYWQQGVDRIPKSDKPDLESATFIERNSHPVLLGIGSMSDEKRWDVLTFDVDSNKFLSTRFFQPGSHFPNIKEVNIEGSCTVGQTIILANRANLTNKANHLLFWQQKNLPVAKEIKLPESSIIAGISGLYYLKEKDLLLLTASEEATDNAISDGEIGSSYLGWIQDFSKKMEDSFFIPEGFIDLGKTNAAFTKQKIESVCVEKIENERYILHLVADNDNGTSKIFKLALNL